MGVERAPGVDQKVTKEDPDLGTCIGDVRRQEL